MSIAALEMFRTIDRIVSKPSVQSVERTGRIEKINSTSTTETKNPAFVLDESLKKKISPKSEEEKVSEVELSEEEKEKVAKLKERDTEVRTHEQAHLSAAGPYAKGGIKLEFESGPDGKQYAKAGHVGIDTSKIEGNPQKSIEKAQTVYSAAMAPGDPSSKDKQVASEAKKMEMESRKELSESTQNGNESGIRFGNRNVYQNSMSQKSGSVLNLVA